MRENRLQMILLDTSILLEVDSDTIEQLTQIASVVVTDIVLQELDGHKNNVNGTVAYRAREFFRQLGKTNGEVLEGLPHTAEKQTGGSGQFARVIVAIEPMEANAEAEYEFEDKVTGGRVPREYIPSVDKGMQAAMESGVLAGYPLVGIKATLLDGAYHDVDSSEMAFKIAGTMAMREAAKKASPVLLEPVMDVEVRTPEEYMGDVIGDLNSRRGQIQSMDEAAGVRVVRALVPLSEMFGYVGDLRSKTQGRAVYSMQFDSYAEVPRNVAEEVIGKSRGE